MRLDSQISITRRARDVEPLRIERYYRPDEWVEMRINPQRISMTSRKVIQRIQTNTRWVFQHWGMEPITIRYNGVTGYIRSITAEVYTDLYLEQDQAYDITKRGVDRPGAHSISPYETPAFQSLMLLRTFYEEPHKQLQGSDLTQIRGSDIDEDLHRLLLKLSYRESNYIGYFTRLEIREEESSPWMWSYEMEFVSYYWKPKMELSRQTIADLTQALFALTPSFNVSADEQLASAWRTGVTATVGESTSE